MPAFVCRYVIVHEHVNDINKKEEKINGFVSSGRVVLYPCHTVRRPKNDSTKNLINFFIHLLGWSGTESTNSEATY
jgi:hypothetical protein